MTLTELYTSRIDALDSRIDDKKNALSDTKIVKSQLDKEYRFWIDRVSLLNAEITKAEISLQATVTVAEIESIAIDLRRLQIDRRASNMQMSNFRQQQSLAELSIANLVNDLDQRQKELEERV